MNENKKILSKYYQNIIKILSKYYQNIIKILLKGVVLGILFTSIDSRFRFIFTCSIFT